MIKEPVLATVMVQLSYELFHNKTGAPLQFGQSPPIEPIPCDDVLWCMQGIMTLLFSSSSRSSNSPIVKLDITADNIITAAYAVIVSVYCFLKFSHCTSVIYCDTFAFTSG